MAVGFLTAGAQALVRSGNTALAVRLSCGLVLMTALLYPLINNDIKIDVNRIGTYRSTAMESIEAFKKEEISLRESLICERCEEYISEQADALGFSCTAEVKCSPDDNGTPIPVSVVLNSPSGRNIELEKLIENNLGIPKEAQSWKE